MRIRAMHLRRVLFRALLVASASLSFVANSSAQEPAAETPASPRVVRVRLLGLFAPERVEALRAAASGMEEASLKEVDYDAAHATFEIRPDRSWKDVPEEKLAERIDQALRNATRSTIAAAPESVTPAEDLIETEIAAYGCVCKACELAAYEAVAKVDGVERAAVSFRDSRIVVRFDRTKTNREALAEALKSRGVALEPPAE